MQIAQDPVTGSHDRRCFAVDEDPKCIPVAGQDGRDDPEGLVIARRSGTCVARCVAVEGDGLVSAAAWPGNVRARVGSGVVPQPDDLVQPFPCPPPPLWPPPLSPE